MFWTQFEMLCSQLGKAPNAVASELKIPSGSITAWSKGTQPRNTTVKKIADYFGVTTQFLLFGETAAQDIKKSPALSSEGLPPGYAQLNAENKAIVDRLIDDLAKAQSSH